MTIKQKTEFMEKLMVLINEYITVDEPEPITISNNDACVSNEMLTVKECAQQFDGLSEHTVRQLALRGEISFIRAGAGKNGKMLISKASLMKKLGIGI